MDEFMAQKGSRLLQRNMQMNYYFMGSHNNSSPSVAVFMQRVTLLVGAATMVAGTRAMGDANTCVSVAYIPSGTHTSWPAQLTCYWT